MIFESRPRESGGGRRNTGFAANFSRRKNMGYPNLPAAMSNGKAQRPVRVDRLNETQLAAWFLHAVDQASTDMTPQWQRTLTQAVARVKSGQCPKDAFSFVQPVFNFAATVRDGASAQDILRQAQRELHVDRYAIGLTSTVMAIQSDRNLR